MIIPWLLAAFALASLVISYLGFRRALKTSTQADLDRVANSTQGKIDKAVLEEREKWEDRMKEKDDRLLDLSRKCDAETERGNRNAARADSLQNLINQGMFGGGGKP